MKNKSYLINFLAIMAIITMSINVSSCNDDDKESQDTVKEKNAKDLIVGWWNFEVTPEIKHDIFQLDFDASHPSITFFDNGMFWEHELYTWSKVYYEDAKPGNYSISKDKLLLKSCYPDGSFFDDNLNIKLNLINEEKLIFQVDDHVYKGTRENIFISDWMEEDAVLYRNDIVGLWSCRIDGNDVDYVVEFKNDGTFEFANGKNPYTGVYSICADWIMIFESSSKCPINGLYEIPNIYDSFSSGMFRLWKNGHSKTEISFEQI